MVLDTSAVLAILFDEPERSEFTAHIQDDPVRLLSAASYLEAGSILDDRFGEGGGAALRQLVVEGEIDVVPVTLDQAEVARDAYRRFGRGNHPAGLNFGDCFSYALSRVSGEPLLFKGDDFSRTDIPVARQNAAPT